MTYDHDLDEIDQLLRSNFEGAAPPVLNAEFARRVVRIEAETRHDLPLISVILMIIAGLAIGVLMSRLAQAALATFDIRTLAFGVLLFIILIPAALTTLSLTRLPGPMIGPER